MQRKIMQSKGITLAGSLLLSTFLFTGEAVAQTAELQLKSSDQVMMFKAFDGTMVVLDSVSERIYIETVDGTSYEVPLEAALAEAQSNANVRDTWRDMIDAGLADSALDSYVYFVQPPPVFCDPATHFCEITPFSGFTPRQDLFSEAWDDDEPPEQEEPPFDLDGITVVADFPGCAPRGGAPDMWSWCYSSGSPAPFTNPGGSVSYQEYIRDDYEEFKNEREDACFDAKLAMAGMLSSSVVAADTCTAAFIGTAATGGGAAPVAGLVCGASLVALTVSSIQHARANNQCAAGYEGPGTH